MKKIIIIGIIIIAIVAGAGYFIYQSKQIHYSLATVERRSIVQEVLSSGNVNSTTTVNLSFQNSGKLIALNAGIGQKVNAGDVLARQDTTVLQAQLQQAQANVSAQTAKLNGLQAGATPQTIAVSQAALATAQQTLANTYFGATNILTDAYVKGNDAVRNQLAAFFSTPEGNNPQLTFSVNDSQMLNNIQSLRASVGVSLNAWQGELASTTTNSSDSALDATLQKTMDYLSPIQNLMNDALTALIDETGLSATTVATYKNSVTVGLNEVNAAITEVNTVEQNLSSEKAAVDQAQAQLNVTNASATPQDIQTQQAQIAQAQASVAAIQAQMAQAVLTAPADGVITQTNGEVGENVTPDMTIVSLIPNSVQEIKLNVSEDNIVGVQLGQVAEITLEAFPNTTVWTGKVVSIDPAQTTIGGAIYYQTTILFDKADPRVKPGMTANVLIETGTASSTLIVPASAIQTNGANTFVEVYQNKKVADQNVTTGLKSQDGMIEITSGLQEGQQVVIGNQ